MTRGRAPPPDGPGAVRARGAGSAWPTPGWEPGPEELAALTGAIRAQSQARRAARRQHVPGAWVSPPASLEPRGGGWGRPPGPHTHTVAVLKGLL